MSVEMKSDHYLAEMLEIMKAQGAKSNPITLQTGVMQSETSVKISDLLLNAEDLYIADYLKAGGLVKGDLVAIQKLNDTNKYVILAKVVEA